MRHVGGDMLVDDIPPADGIFMKVNYMCFLVKSQNVSLSLGVSKVASFSFQRFSINPPYHVNSNFHMDG